MKEREVTIQKMNKTPLFRKNTPVVHTDQKSLVQLRHRACEASLVWQLLRFSLTPAPESTPRPPAKASLGQSQSPSAPSSAPSAAPYLQLQVRRGPLLQEATAPAAHHGGPNCPVPPHIFLGAGRNFLGVQDKLFSSSTPAQRSAQG